MTIKSVVSLVYVSFSLILTLLIVIYTQNGHLYRLLHVTFNYHHTRYAVEIFKCDMSERRRN